MIYSQLEQDVKWKLSEFRQKSPPLGDSNVEYDYALEIIAIVRERLAQEIEANDDSPYPCGCVDDAAKIARGK